MPGCDLEGLHRRYDTALDGEDAGVRGLPNAQLPSCDARCDCVGIAAARNAQHERLRRADAVDDRVVSWGLRAARAAAIAAAVANIVDFGAYDLRIQSLDMSTHASSSEDDTQPSRSGDWPAAGGASRPAARTSGPSDRGCSAVRCGDLRGCLVRRAGWFTQAAGGSGGFAHAPGLVCRARVWWWSRFGAWLRRRHLAVSGRTCGQAQQRAGRLDGRRDRVWRRRLPRSRARAQPGLRRQQPCRYAGDRLAGLDVLGYDGACADQSPLANPDAGHDDRA